MSDSLKDTFTLPCNAVHRNGEETIFCTRDKGHEAAHRGEGRYVTAQWSNDEPKQTEATFRDFKQLSDSGMLWLINRVVFHPRGFSLTLHVDNGVALGWSIQGNGKEVWTFSTEDDDESFASANATLQALLGDVR